MIKIDPKNTIIVLAGGLVVILGLAGYIMFLSQKETTEVQVSPEIRKIQTQSASDETPAIEADLNNTDIDSIDKDLNDMQALLQ